MAAPSRLTFTRRPRRQTPDGESRLHLCRRHEQQTLPDRPHATSRRVRDGPGRQTDLPALDVDQSRSPVGVTRYLACSKRSSMLSRVKETQGAAGEFRVAEHTGVVDDSRLPRVHRRRQLQATHRRQGSMIGWAPREPVLEGSARDGSSGGLCADRAEYPRIAPSRPADKVGSPSGRRGRCPLPATVGHARSRTPDPGMWRCQGPGRLARSGETFALSGAASVLHTGGSRKEPSDGGARQGRTRAAAGGRRG